MKTFKQFREGYMGPAVTPKNYEPKDTIIRTTDVKMKSAEKFRKGTGFNLPIPITKRKLQLKQYKIFYLLCLILYILVIPI